GEVRHIVCHGWGAFYAAANEFENVLGAGHRRGALAQQLVGANAHRIENAAGYRQHVAALLEREIGRDQRAAAVAGFDDNRSARQARDDAIASGKIDRVRRYAGREFRDERAAAVLGNPPRQRAVFRWIDLIEAIPEDGKGSTACLES